MGAVGGGCLSHGAFLQGCRAWSRSGRAARTGDVCAAKGSTGDHPADSGTRTSSVADLANPGGPSPAAGRSLAAFPYHGKVADTRAPGRITAAARTHPVVTAGTGAGARSSTPSPNPGPAERPWARVSRRTSARTVALRPRVRPTHPPSAGPGPAGADRTPGRRLGGERPSARRGGPLRSTAAATARRTAAARIPGPPTALDRGPRPATVPLPTAPCVRGECPGHQQHHTLRDEDEDDESRHGFPFPASPAERGPARTEMGDFSLPVAVSAACALPGGRTRAPDRCSSGAAHPALLHRSHRPDRCLAARVRAGRQRNRRTGADGWGLAWVSLVAAVADVLGWAGSRQGGGRDCGGAP